MKQASPIAILSIIAGIIVILVPNIINYIIGLYLIIVGVLSLKQK